MIEKNRRICKLKAVSLSTYRLINFFRLTDSLVKKACFAIIYCYVSINCKVTYCRKTFHHSFADVSYHVVTSILKGKGIKDTKKSTLSNHLLQFNFIIIFIYF